MRPAVIFDVDGTLCDVRPIRHYVQGEQRNFNMFHKASLFCFPNPAVLGINRALRPEIASVVVTARGSEYVKPTWDWLVKYDVRVDAMFMRGWRDQRPDYVVKKEILSKIRREFEVVYAIDDNPSVIELWKQEQIPTLEIPGFF